MQVFNLELGLKVLFLLYYLVHVQLKCPRFVGVIKAACGLKETKTPVCRQQQANPPIAHGTLQFWKPKNVHWCRGVSSRQCVPIALIEKHSLASVVARGEMPCNRDMPLAMAWCQNAIFWKWHYGTMHIQLRSFLTVSHLPINGCLFLQLTKPPSFGQHPFSFFGWNCAEGM